MEKPQTRKKILICDDEKKIRNIYINLLIGEGYEIFEAVNAPDANETLVREGIDLILLDIKMPEVDGETMYDVIEMFHKDVKVIVSSVYHVSDQKRRIKNAHEYHDKSHGVDILLEKIKKVLKSG